MRCQYCEAITEPTEGGFPDRCFECGAWFDFNKQIKSWEETLAVVISCLRDTWTHRDKHDDCADELEAMSREMVAVSK